MQAKSTGIGEMAGTEPASKLEGEVPEAVYLVAEKAETRIRAGLDECCSRRCLSLIEAEHLRNLRHDLGRLDKRALEFYVLIILQQCRVSHGKSSRRKERQRDVYKYCVQPLGEMCRAAFVHVFDISKARLDALQEHLRETNSVLPRVHGNLHIAQSEDAGATSLMTVSWQEPGRRNGKVVRSKAWKKEPGPRRASAWGEPVAERPTIPPQTPVLGASVTPLNQEAEFASY